MESEDYFETKVLACVDLTIQCLVREWQSLQPHEPELRAQIQAWGAEFMEHFREHVPLAKPCFALNDPSKPGPLKVSFELRR